MRFVHLGLLFYGPAMLHAITHFPGPIYKRALDDWSSRQLVEGTLRLLRNHYCAICLDYCADPQAALQRMSAKEWQKFRVYRLREYIVRIPLVLYEDKAFSY